MTAPSALDLVAEVRRLGGVLTPNPNGTLGVDLYPEDMRRLLPLLRQRKPDLLMLLRQPSGPCPAGHDGCFWQDAVGQYHCEGCEPNPGWHHLRGVTLEVLGNRAISLQPPTGDLPGAGSWAKTPAGAVCELVLYREDGGEVLMRGLKSERLAWFEPAALSWEIDWPWE